MGRRRFERSGDAPGGPGSGHFQLIFTFFVDLCPLGLRSDPDGGAEVAPSLKGTLIDRLDGGAVRVTLASGESVEGRIVVGSAPVYEPIAGAEDVDGVLLAPLPLAVGGGRRLVEPTRVRLVTQERVGSFLTIVVETTGADPVRGRIEDVDRDALAKGQVRYRQG